MNVTSNLKPNLQQASDTEQVAWEEPIPEKIGGKQIQLDCPLKGTVQGEFLTHIFSLKIDMTMDMPRSDFESLNIHGVICIKILKK